MTKYFTLQLALLSIKLAHTSMMKRKQAQRENHLSLLWKSYILPIFISLLL